VIAHALILAWVALAAWPSPSSVRAQVPLTCRSLLTDAQVSKVVRASMPMMGPMTADGVETTCTWAAFGGPDGIRRLTVVYGDPRQATPTVALDAAFEKTVADVEALGEKREAITGVGVNAAFVAGDPMHLVVIQRRDGIARLNSRNLTKAQLIEIARLIAAR
jgi:hypothetical protein